MPIEIDYSLLYKEWSSFFVDAEVTLCVTTIVSMSVKDEGLLLILKSLFQINIESWFYLWSQINSY